MKIKQFSDLVAWKEALALTVLLYEITALFPKAELYGLTQQIRRAAVSIGSNIAEGFGRQSIKEKIHFFYIANGSITELKNQLYIAKHIHYLDDKNFAVLYTQAETCHRVLSGLITKTKSLLNSRSL